MVKIHITPRSVCDLDKVSYAKFNSFRFLWLIVTSCSTSLIVFFFRGCPPEKETFPLLQSCWLFSLCLWWREFCGWKIQVSTEVPGWAVGMGEVGGDCNRNLKEKQPPLSCPVVIWDEDHRSSDPSASMYHIWVPCDENEKWWFCPQSPRDHPLYNLAQRKTI